VAANLVGDAGQAPGGAQGHGPEQPPGLCRSGAERPIDVAISPQQATIGSLLRHVRRGDVVMVHSPRRGAAEAIGAVVLGDRGLMAHHDIVIEAKDHVILFLRDKCRVTEVELLFHVGATFL
jgi:trk system potassium uptake protein